MSLLVYRRILSQGYVSENLGNRVIATDVYSPKPIYIFRGSDGKTETMIRVRKKEFLKTFPGKEKEMKEILKKNHIRNIREESDLVKVARLLTE